MEATLAAVDVRAGVEALYRADAHRLWRAVYAFAGDADIASDAVAEAYAQVIRRGDAVADPAGWTWRSAFRIAAGALKARRADAARQAAPEVDGGSEVRLADAASPDRYADVDLHRALQQLPPNQRAAVVLFYYADLPIREIAARLETNGIAVRANLSRGRRRLRDLLGDHHG